MTSFVLSKHLPGTKTAVWKKAFFLYFGVGRASGSQPGPNDLLKGELFLSLRRTGQRLPSCTEEAWSFLKACTTFYLLICSSSELQLTLGWGWPETWQLIIGNYWLILNLLTWNIHPLDPWLGSIWRRWLPWKLRYQKWPLIPRGKFHFLLERDGLRSSKNVLKAGKKGKKDLLSFKQIMATVSYIKSE